MIGQILLQLILIALNAIFACAEIAVISSNETRIDKLAEQGLSEFFVKTVAFPIKLCYNCIHRRQVFLPHFIFTVHFMQKCHGIQQEAYNYENTRIR